MKLLIIERAALLARRPPGESRVAASTDLPLHTLEAVSRLTHAGHHVVLVSHEANVARGLLEMSTVNAAHRRLARQVEESGGRIDAVAVCAHAPDAGCSCRMPQPGMILDLLERFDAAASATVVIAATGAAVTAGLAAGCITWRLKGEDEDENSAPVPTVVDLDDAATRLASGGETAGTAAGHG